MYYLAGRGGGVPTPAEAPSRATLDSRHEWEYSQSKHQTALKNVRGLVDQSMPNSIDERRLDVQARTRRFCEDQRRAETGRENRKLVEKLASISRGTAGVDPRAPPPSLGTHGAPQAGARSLGAPRPSATLSASGSLIGERSRTLNETHRRRTQRSIEQENAALLRRILAVKPTFDKKAEAEDFRQHQRTVQLLQRHSDGGQAGQAAARRPSSLPPRRQAPAMGKLVGRAQGLNVLLLPGDLQRCESGPSSLLSSQRRASSPAESARSRKSRSPAESPRSRRSRSPADSARSRSGSRTPRSERSYGGSFPGSERSGDRRPTSSEGKNSERDGSSEGSSLWPQHDKETERRRWVAEQEASQASPARARAERGDTRGITGLSVDSELKYAENWDEFSMTSSTASPQLRAGLTKGGTTGGSPLRRSRG